MKRIVDYYKPHLIRLIILVFVKITGVVLELMLPILLSFIIDDIVPNKEMIDIILYGMLMVVLSILAFFCNNKANQNAAYIAKCVTTNLRKDLFTKIMSMSEAQTDSVTIPSLVTRMSNDTYNIHQMLAMIFRLGVRAPVLLFGGIIATLFLDAKLSLVIISTLPFVGLVLFLISKISLPLFSKVQLSMDKLTLSLRENMTGIRVIKSLSKEDYERKRFDKISKDVINYELKSSYVMSTLNPIVNFILNTGLICVLVVGAIRVNNGYILPGKVLSFTVFFSMILNALISISRMLTIISKALASSHRIDYIFDLGKDLEKKDIDKTSNAFIEFNDVSFSYLGKNDNVSNISFKINKGETLGIIGSTGSGKSTIIQLLLRLYDVNSGNIFIDGKDIRCFDEYEIKKYFGTALQYDTLFSDSIYNNVDFYRHLSKEDVLNALDNAMCDFVDKLDKKEQYVLSSKGTNLSGGQRQRLIIARSIAASPKILILDDSTSALDYKTDSLLRANLKNNYKETTKIIVSSRISSIKDADHILVLEEGKIIGYGTHDELIANCDIYSEIALSQLGGDMDE